MIVTIMQPAYLPWLGYFARIAASDLHVVLDNVQFEKNSFTNRNKIRTGVGWCWLSVPVETGGKFGALTISDLRITSDLRWARKHWLTIEQNYSKAEHYSEHRAFFENIYASRWGRLADLLDITTDYLLNALGVSTRLLKASSLSIATRKSALVLDICRAIGARTYLSGPLGRSYLDRHAFTEAGIDVVFHDYSHPTYPQAHPGFEPYMSALDLLLNCGPNSLGILADLPVRRLH